LVVSNTGQGSLTFEISERDDGFQPTLAGEDVLVVNRYSDLTADALEAALVALGHSYLEVNEAGFQAIAVDDLLDYDLLIWAGSTGSTGSENANEVHLKAYLDAGGSILHVDNDLGYYRHGTPYYDSYLHAIYGVDDATDTDSSPQLITGLDLMAPLVVDLTTELYPDGVVPRDAAATPLFVANGPADPAYPYVGLLVEGSAYRAIYLAFDFNYVAGSDMQIELVRRAYDWLSVADVPWLTESITSGIVAPGDAVPVTLTFQPSVLAEPGTYRARLRFKSNDPQAQPSLDYPVVMEVLPPVPVLSLEKKSSAARIDIGLPLVYTLTVTNEGGKATGVVISDSLPAGTVFAWAGGGGSLAGGDVVWSGLTLPAASKLDVSYGVTVSCVASGTLLVNDSYQVVAAEWLTPTTGAPLVVTAVDEGPHVAMAYGPLPALVGRPLHFTTLSANVLTYEWAFGDGGTSAEAEPVHTYGAPPAEYTVVVTGSNACHYDVDTKLVSVENYAVAMTPAKQDGIADAGQSVTYTLQVTNAGTLSDVFDLGLLGVAWPTELSTDTVALGAGEALPVKVTVTVPPNAGGGTKDDISVVARSLSDPRLPPASATVDLSTMANPTYGVKLGPPSSAQSAWATGETVTYTLRVTNTSNVVDTIAFSRLQPGWPTSFSTPSRTIAPGGWRLVEVYVTVPAGASGVAPDVAVIRATGSGGYAEVTLTTTLARRRVYVPLVMRNTISP
jgi:uncharacterized repeat protein (TIGR01451 family)